ncbi:MAG: hypothetical protein ACR2K9_02350 [Solirubrobacteraceae bacterium]
MPDREHVAAQATLEAPGARRAAPAGADHEGTRRRRPGWASWPLIAAVVCGLIAVVSVLVLPSLPSFDPFSWIVWGREIVDSGTNFETNGGPSWKPLPVLFTSVFGLFGDAAPNLWLVVARTGGLLALAGAYRLGERVAGRAAGLIAAIGLLLTTDWLRYLERGASEPLLVGCVLWAVIAHIEGFKRTAFFLGVGAALVRPEAWPFVGLYALWLARHETWRTRGLLLAGLLLIPLLWFVPPWIASDDPFSASSHAASYNGHLGSSPGLEVLRRATELAVVPIMLAALAALVLAVRRRERLTLGLAAAALAWIGLVFAMTVAAHYPGLPRFMLPAAAFMCVLAGIGAVWLVELAPSRALAIALGVILLAGGVAGSVGRVGDFKPQYQDVQLAERNFNSLDRAVKQAGGRRLILRCGRHLVAVNHSFQTALAWKLKVELGVVRPFVRHPAIVFRGPRIATLGSPPTLSYRPRSLYQITHAGVWRAFGVLPQGARPAAGCPHAA